MDVQGLKSYVRTHLDVDDEELPDSLLNVYLQDAFDTTMAFSNRWPRNEKTWPATKAPGVDYIHLPADLNQPSIMSVMAVVNRYPLVAVNHENAEQQWAPTGQVGTPSYYSLWGDQMFLWPMVNTDEQFDVSIRGYRQPVWDNTASTIPDIDVRVHVALAYYAMSLAYGQQEDEVLEAVWLARWERGVQTHLKSILQPSHHRPLVLNGGAAPFPTTPFRVEPPVSP